MEEDGECCLRVESLVGDVFLDDAGLITGDWNGDEYGEFSFDEKVESNIIF